MSTNEGWEYCQINFQLRNKGEDFTRAGMKHMWLVFQAQVSSPQKNFLAAESMEIPIAANLIGASYVPQKQNASHVHIHETFIQDLQRAGWQRLSEKGSAWWEFRLRRPVKPQPTLKTFFARLQELFK